MRTELSLLLEPQLSLPRRLDATISSFGAEHFGENAGFDLCCKSSSYAMLP